MSTHSKRMEHYYRGKIGELLADKAAGKRISINELLNYQRYLADAEAQTASDAQKEFEASQRRLAREVLEKTEAMHRRMEKERREQERRQRWEEERAREREQEELARLAEAEEEEEQARQAYSQASYAVVDSLAHAENLLERIQGTKDIGRILPAYGALGAVCKRVRQIFDAHSLDDLQARRDLLALEKAVRALATEHQLPDVTVTAQQCEHLLRPYEDTFDEDWCSPIEDLPTLSSTSHLEVQRTKQTYDQNVRAFRTLAERTRERVVQARKHGLLEESDEGQLVFSALAGPVAQVLFSVEGLTSRAELHPLLKFFNFCRDEQRVAEALKYYESSGARWLKQYDDTRAEVIALLDQVSYYRPAVEVIVHGAPVVYTDILTDSAVQGRLQDDPPGIGDRLAVAAGLISGALLILGAIALFKNASKLLTACSIGLVISGIASFIAKRREKAEGSQWLDRAKDLLKQKWPAWEGGAHRP